jgi:transposase
MHSAAFKNNFKNCPGPQSCSLLKEALHEKNRFENENFQVVKILETAKEEFRKKEKQIINLQKEIERLREIEKENKSLKDKVIEIQAKANIYAKMLFDKKSEKQKDNNNKDKENDDYNDNDDDKKTSFDNKNKTDKRKRGGQPGHTGSGRKIPKNLTIIEQIIELPDDEKCCEYCGKTRKETIFEDISYEITVETKYYVKKIIRKIYKSKCKCNNCKGLITAPLPPKIIPRGKYSTEFWVQCLLDKYMNHTPVNRQLTEMKMNNVNVSAGTIFGGFKYLYEHYLEPLYSAMESEIQNASHFHADETRWHIFTDKEGKTNHKWYIWTFISENTVLYTLDPSRSAKVPYKVLFNIDIEDRKNSGSEPLSTNGEKKILNADRYSAYKVLEKDGLIIIAFCWTHQRRDFTNLKTKYPDDKNLIKWADEWIEKIGNLYHINNKRIEYLESFTAKGSSEFNKYQKLLEEAIKKLECEIDKEYEHPVKKKIMQSMHNHWNGLKIFVTHPDIPMDNNKAERMMVYPVLGRKNYWGNHSEWGGHFSACMFSIIQSCLKNNISPKVFLMYYLNHCKNIRGTPTKEDIKSFLPHKIDKNILEAKVA